MSNPILYTPSQCRALDKTKRDLEFPNPELLLREKEDEIYYETLIKLSRGKKSELKEVRIGVKLLLLFLKTSFPERPELELWTCKEYIDLYTDLGKSYIRYPIELYSNSARS